MNTQTTAQSIAIVTLLLASFQAAATDIAREVQNSGYGNGSFAEFGISFATASEPLVGFGGDGLDGSEDRTFSIDINLEGRLEYKRVFIEFIENSFSNVALGFNAYSTPNSNHEIVAASLFNNVVRSDVVGFESIEKRDGDLNLGFRSSYFFDSNIVQVELVSDVSSAHNGVIGTLQFGHQTQLRNWSLHGLLGVRYFTDNVIDHLFGVSSDEATDTVQAYKADDGFMPTVQVGATLPLNEKWIFRANAEYSKMPSAVSDSPLVRGDAAYNASIGVFYVLHGS